MNKLAARVKATAVSLIPKQGALGAEMGISTVRQPETVFENLLKLVDMGKAFYSLECSRLRLLPAIAGNVIEWISKGVVLSKPSVSTALLHV